MGSLTTDRLSSDMEWTGTFASADISSWMTGALLRFGGGDGGPFLGEGYDEPLSLSLERVADRRFLPPRLEERDESRDKGPSVRYEHRLEGAEYSGGSCVVGLEMSVITEADTLDE